MVRNICRKISMFRNASRHGEFVGLEAGGQAVSCCPYKSNPEPRVMLLQITTNRSTPFQAAADGFVR